MHFGYKSHSEGSASEWNSSYSVLMYRTTLVSIIEHFHIVSNVFGYCEGNSYSGIIDTQYCVSVSILNASVYILTRTVTSRDVAECTDIPFFIFLCNRICAVSGSRIPINTVITGSRPSIVSPLRDIDRNGIFRTDRIS